MSESVPRPPSVRRVPVSIVCVFTDPHVLATCLQRSIDAGRHDAPATELIAVDNRAATYPTAGSALNFGARQAQHEVVVFVHQDVVLHSIPALEAAAADLLATAGIGMLGAVGINRRGRIIGHMRDRVVRIGAVAPRPRDVESLDEVLFMIRRDQVLDEPLSEDPALAWHAYAVEYSLRVRRAGLRATARDIPLTHNSMSTNLANLDVAHRRLGELYPQMLPIVTTCGTVAGDRLPAQVQQVVRRARGARTWLQESVVAGGVSRASGAGAVVLADIRMLVDEAARIGGFEEIRIVDVRRDGTAPLVVDGIERLGRGVSAAAMTLPEVDAEISGRPASRLLLVANLHRGEVADLGALAAAPHVIGYWRDTGLWVLVGAPPDDVAPLWSRRRNRPYGGITSSLGARA